MYYPMQIPYLLDKEFRKNIQYEEHQIETLSDYCMCIWTMQSKRVLNKTIYNYILPDACIDIVINFSARNVCFAGFSRETIPFELNQKTDFMGARLKPGSFHTIFGISAEKIMDNPLPFSEIESMESLEKIFTLTNITERLNVFRRYLEKKICHKPSVKPMEMVEQLYGRPEEQNVIRIAKDYGYNERHLYRIFKTNYGISPKVLLNILRLHLCLFLILENNMSLMDIANICGFYDQSHFIKEIRKYTGFSSLQLLEKYR